MTGIVNLKESIFMHESIIHVHGVQLFSVQLFKVGASMVKYGRACKIFETTPTDLVAVQPFKVVCKQPKVLIHASTVQT